MEIMTLYGLALIEAYNLENNLAVNPRIILSNNMVGLVKEHMKFYGGDINAPQNFEILCDQEDNLYFLKAMLTAFLGNYPKLEAV